MLDTKTVQKAYRPVKFPHCSQIAHQFVHQFIRQSKSWLVASTLAFSALVFLQANSVYAQEPLVDLASELAKIKKENNSLTVPEDEGQLGEESKDLPAGKEAQMSGDHGGDGVHWSYSGDTGPRHWGKLSSDYTQCDVGKSQSPIDLREKTAVGAQGLPELDIRYRDVPLKIKNNGHSIQVDYPLGSYIKVGGKRYELMQYHFHTPSEHQKEGFNYPMEVHLVHKDGDGNYAVIGILFQEGEENAALNTLLQHLPKEMHKLELHENVSLNPVKFLPVNTEFFKYSGSLTTPPCTEGVYWMVFKQPIQASAKQIMQMNEILGENARPVQSLNSRAVLKSWLEVEQDTQFYEFY